MSGEPGGAWRPTLHPDLKLELVEGEAIVLDRANERVHQLNEVSTFILQCCDGTRTGDDIIAAMTERYDVSHATAAADATDVLAKMKALEILV